MDRLAERARELLGQDTGAIAEAGRQKLLARHTSVHRARTVLERLQALRLPEAGVVTQRLTARSGEPVRSNERPDIEALVPPGTQALLDVGCGTGRLGGRR